VTITPSPPTPGPGGCTAGWPDDPCPSTAEPGCELDGYPACGFHYEDACSYGTDDPEET